ncbi:MAG TPA: DHA2 family efflux MFS transporter permease subunit [Ktedonobacterales bacterium]
MRTTNRYIIALVVALGLIPVVLDTTIVTIALTPIQADLHSDVNTVQWIVTGYFLANAALVTVGGYLATRFGQRRLFVAGIAIFTLGSALCGVAPGIGWLIAFRIAQGIGGGILLPIGPALAFDAFPKEERAKASAVVAVPVLLAPVFGPIVGGYLNDRLGWHSIFFVNLPIGALAIAAALWALPRDTPEPTSGRRFDFTGLGLSTIGIIAIVYAFKLVTQTRPHSASAANPGSALYGWGYWLVWALIGVGMLALAAFTFWVLRLSRDPALDLRQFARRDFLVSNLFSWMTSIISFGLLVLLPLYFESVRAPRLSALKTGVALVPFGLGTLLGTVIGAIVYRALGPRLVVLLGSALTTASAWLLAQTVHPTATAAQLLASAKTGVPVPSVAGPSAMAWWMFALGMGFVMVAVSVQTLALEALKGEALAKASSLVLSTKFIFSSVGVAILTTILVDETRSHASALAAQLRALGGAASASPTNPGAASALKAVQEQIATQAGTAAIHDIFLMIFVGSFALIALALLLPGRKRADAEPLPEEEPSTIGAAV